MRARSPHAGTAIAATAIIMSARIARAADDIRDLRGPKTAVSGWPLPAIIAALLAVGCALFFLWRRMRRRPLPATLTAAERALADLEAARSLLAASRAREFCDAASDVVRRYIETQFAISAQRRTTEEFLQQLASLPASPVAAHQAALAEFMQRADFVRFSGASPGSQSLEALYQAARTFILDTSAVRNDPLPAT